MNKEKKNCQNCNKSLSPQASDDSLYYWCFLIKDSKEKYGLSEVRLGSTISKREEMLAEFEAQMPNREVMGYTSISQKFLEDKRQIFVVINGQLHLNPEMLPLN